MSELERFYRINYISSRSSGVSPSAQCTEVANQARRLFSMIRRSFQDLSKWAFIPLYEALVRPHLEYGMPNRVADINHLERIQRLATRLVTDNRHLPYEERPQRMSLHSLQRRQRLRADLITAFKIFTEKLDVDLNSPPPTHSARPKRAPLQVFQDTSHRRKGGSAFFGEKCEILE